MANRARLSLMLSVAFTAVAVPAQAQVLTILTDRAAFEAAQPSVQSAAYPSFDSLAVVAPTIPGIGTLVDAGCDDSIVATLGGNSVTITAPAALPSALLPGLAHPICITGPASFALLPQTNTDPDPASPTIAGNGEDDYDLVFANPVSAVGFEVVTNAAAIEQLQFFDANGQSLGIVRNDDGLETSPNAFEFFGFVSAVPIGRIFVDTTDGAFQNEGLIEILAPVGQAPTKVDFPGDTNSLQEACDLVADGGTIEIGKGQFEESCVISNKQLRIVGAGREKTTLVGGGSTADPTTPLELISAALTLINGGGVRIQDIGLTGWDAAVRGDDGGALAVEDVVVEGESAFGIVGSFEGVELHDVDLSIRFSGVLLSEIGDLGVLATDTVIENAEYIAVLIFNVSSFPAENGEIWLSDVHVVGELFGTAASKGGIIVVGDAYPLIIQDSTVEVVGGLGIALYHVADARVSDVLVGGVGETEFEIFGEPERVAYGILAKDCTDVRLTDVFVQDIISLQSLSVGIVMDHSPGRLRGVTSAVSADIGLAVLGEAVDAADDSNLFLGNEYALLLDAPLSVPSAPALPGQ